MITTVPFVNEVNIKEHTILYSNKILDLKEKDTPLCIATINNISPYMLENKIEEVFKTHKDIDYYMVQYDEKNKLLIFYTYESLINNNNNNKTIIDNNNNNNIDNINLYNYYENIQKEFENFNKIETMIPLKNESTVSLQDIIDTYYIIEQRYNKQISNVREQLNNILAKRETKPLIQSYLNLNIEKNEIEYNYRIGETFLGSSSGYKIYLKIINDKLFFTNMIPYTSCHSPDEKDYITNKIIENYETIKEMLTNILEYKKYITTNKQIIKSLNSNIILKINNDFQSLNLYYKNTNSKFSIIINKDKPLIKSESLELHHYLLENIDTIKDQLIFYKADCPIWMQDYWKNIKKISEESPINEEIKPVVEELSDEVEPTSPNQYRISIWPFKRK